MKISQWFGAIERLEERRLLSLGGLDSSFSGDGTQTYPFAGQQFVENASSFDMAPDGKIIVAGTTKGRDGNSQILLARFNADGEVDRSFGSDGEVITSLAGPVGPLETVAAARKVRVQRDGKILVAGQCGNGWAVFRFNSDGSLDPSFDHDGIQNFDANHGEVAVDLELLPDGKILVGGSAESEDYSSTHSSDFAVMRLKSDGAIDGSFGINGYVLSDLGYHDQLQQIAVDRAGNILATGESSLSERFGFNSRIVLVRYRSNGALDTTFGKRGKVITSMPGGDVHSLQSLHNGHILVSGSNGKDAFLMRLDKRGTLDRGFGKRGMVSIDLGSNDDGATVLQADRRGILVLGAWGQDYYPYPPTDRKQFLLNFRPDGSTDSRSPRREMTLEMDGPQLLSGGARIVGDNQVLALFSTSMSGDAGRLTLARFNVSGGIDSTFAQRGSFTITLKGPLRGTPLRAIAQPDGKSIILADLATWGKTSYVLLRMDADGNLDPFFGEEGRVDLGPADSFDEYALALDGAGKIVLAGVDWNLGGSFVQRFNIDGSSDNSFGDHGLVRLANGPDSPSQVVALPDGKLLVEGSNDGGIGVAPLVVLRLNANGSIDKGFAQNGTLIDSFDDANDLSDLLVGADGKLTVVGTASEYHDLAPAYPVRVFIGRYNANGSIDRSFSRVLMDDTEYAYEARLTSDGGVVVLAYGTGGQDFKLIRYNAHGTRVGTTTGRAPDMIVRAFFETDGRIVILTRTSTVRLAADGSAIPGSKRGAAIGHGSDEFGGEIYGGVISITPNHKLLLASTDSDGDLTLWKYLLD